MVDAAFDCVVMAWRSMGSGGGNIALGIALERKVCNKKEIWRPPSVHTIWTFVSHS